MTAIVLGIDIGGTKIAAGLVTATGRVLARAQCATPAREGGERILGVAAALGRDLLASDDAAGELLAVGVGSAGVIDASTGRVLSATDHLSGWAGTEIAAQLERAFAVPVVACNDVHAHALGEAFVGAGRGHSTVLVVAVGTGIGGALVLDGAAQFGAHGVAGHLGHLSIDEAAGVVCSCGRSGHVEGIASGPGLLNLFRRRGGGPGVLDSRAVVRRADTDPVARDTVVTAATALGKVLGGVINLIDPDVLIVGGGMAHAGPLWWDSMNAGIAQMVLPLLAGTRATPASLGGDAAIIGAAKRAFEAIGVPTC